MFPGNIRTIRINEKSKNFNGYVRRICIQNGMKHCLFSIAEYITSMISKWENHSSKAVTESKSNGMQTLV